jgi:glycosyltransferase involved in cell wall biosynthesis
VQILYSFPHRWGAPGIGTTACKQVESLARLGHDVTLVTTSTDVAVPANVRTIRTLQPYGRRIPHRAFGSMARAMAYHDVVVAGILRRADRRFDAVHTWPLAGARTLAVARSRGVAGFREAPNCHTEHAYAVVDAEMQRLGLAVVPGHSHAVSPDRLAVEQAEYAAAARILVPSPFVEQTFLDRGIPPWKLARHRYGFDPVDFPAVEGSAPAGGGLPAVFVGRCEPRKGLHFALQAWQRSAASREGTLRIYGTFQPGYRDALGSLLEQRSVSVEGFTSDVPAVLASADALLLPSVEEGSALVTYEAQAAGTIPVVSSAAGAYCEHGVNGLVHEAGDVEKLTAHLDALLDRPERTRLRAGVLAHRGHLTWDAAARLVADHYATAILGSPRDAVPPPLPRPRHAPAVPTE